MVKKKGPGAVGSNMGLLLFLVIGVVPRALDDLLLDGIDLEPQVVVVAAPLVDKIHHLLGLV